MSRLSTQLEKIITPKLFVNRKQFKEFLTKVQRDDLIKIENPESHFCVFFIPYKSETREIFIVYHKKAKQWVVPGGHIEKGETLEDAVKREANEELGLDALSIPD